MKVYDLIEDVLKKADRPLTEFEFSDILMPNPNKESIQTHIFGRQYVGCTESTLGRRMREMRELGRLTSKKREGKQFMEYALALCANTAA